jgi:ATP synthase protein I
MTGRDDAVRRERRELEERLDRQVERMRKADRERRNLLSETAYLGTIGVLFVLPVIGGAYLGRWLDERLLGYSVHWTISLILLGVLLGAANVYFFIRD